MGIHILIIEAENRFRKNLYKCLQAEGFTVDKATQQDDVETIVAKEKIDTVLLGVDGLGREGLALIRPIKTISPTTEIIIINDPGHMDLSIEGWNWVLLMISWFPGYRFTGYAHPGGCLGKD